MSGANEPMHSDRSHNVAAVVHTYDNRGTSIRGIEDDEISAPVSHKGTLIE